MTTIRFPKQEDGINIFHPDIQDAASDYHPSGLDNLFKAEEGHFWFKARKNKIKEMLNKYLLKETNILDLGGVSFQGNGGGINEVKIIKSNNKL